MTTKIFDRKLLEFMYFLTKQPRFMNSQQVSKILTINGKKVTDRTIRRWFNALKKDRNFNYFLNTKQTQMATIPTWVLAKDLRSTKIFDIIPYRTYLIDGICLKTLKKAYLAQFYVPKESAKKFELFWAKAKKQGLVGNYSLFQHKPSVSLYQQFHKSLDSHGRVKYCTEPLHQDFLKLLEQTLSEGKVELHPKISKHPILIPLLCELYGEHFLSHELWKNIKFKLGAKVWTYLPYRMKGDDAAISYIQRLLKEIYCPSGGLIQQLRISYTPIYLNNIGIYFFIKLKEHSKFLDFVKDICRYSVHTVISPAIKSSGIHTIYAVTGQETLGSFFEMVNNYAQHNINNNIFLQNLKRSDVTYSKIDYARCFDLKTCTWRYEHKKYMKELNQLANSTK